MHGQRGFEYFNILDMYDVADRFGTRNCSQYASYSYKKASTVSLTGSAVVIIGD